MILWTGTGSSHYNQLARDTPPSVRSLAHTSSSCPPRVAPEQYPRTFLTYTHSSPSHLAIGSLSEGQPRPLRTAPVPTSGLDITPGLHLLQLELFLQGAREGMLQNLQSIHIIAPVVPPGQPQHRMFENPGPFPI